MPRYAAVDIGSNSIRMLAAEAMPGRPPETLAAEREVTRLGESVFHSGHISPQAMALTCGVLAKMAQRYKALDVVGVRAVATSSVRDARNQVEFIKQASAALDTQVEVISGREEARLIYEGVESRWPHPHQRVVIVDIGGGSVEIIAGENGRMKDAVSKPLGAVRLRELFLAGDPPAGRELHRMQEYIEEKLAGAVQRFHGRWDRALGTSGTASAAASLVAGVPRSRRDDADRLRVPTRRLRKLYRRLSSMSLADRRKLTGIGPRRAEIIVPGVAVLLWILEGLQLPAFHYSSAGVRDGIIADLSARGVGREAAQLSHDQRREVEQMCLRYGVALRHARKVASLARSLFSAFQALHRLPPAHGKLLEAAAYLHDIGHYVSDSSHHKHSHYLVANSDMPGFTGRERALIASLCRYHRKAMPSPDHPHTRLLDTEEWRALLMLIPLLRVADGLDSSHDQRIATIACEMQDSQAVIKVISGADIDLDQWAAERAGEIFRQVYRVPLIVQRAPR